MILLIMQLDPFEVPSITIWTLAWVFIIIGILSLTVLVLYTKYGRELSIKLAVSSIIFASVFIGFAIHFFLISAGV